MYDLDVATMLERLQKVPNATLLCSNPCFELWLLLHYADIRSELTSEECVKRLTAFIHQYKKGVLNITDIQFLMQNVPVATERAKLLSAYGNPSSTVYLLLDELETMKTNQYVKNEKS